MTFAFTICSNNYLAQAIVLGKSWLRHHPETRFAIVLVDELDDAVDYGRDERFILLPLGEIPLDNLPELVRRYNITELNTAIKADAFLHISRTYKPDKILYIDPDVRVYGRFDEVLGLLDDHDLVVTPHYCMPIDDDKSTTDVAMIGIGLFNLGFLAIARPETLTPFFEWWRQRLYRYCHYDPAQSLFYDQVWMNFIVVFFDKWHVLKHPGYNMANWNFHERVLSQAGDDAYLVNDRFPLRFFISAATSWAGPTSSPPITRVTPSTPDPTSRRSTTPTGRPASRKEPKRSREFPASTTSGTSSSRRRPNPPPGDSCRSRRSSGKWEPGSCAGCSGRQGPTRREETSPIRRSSRSPGRSRS